MTRCLAPLTLVMLVVAGVLFVTPPGPPSPVHAAPLHQAHGATPTSTPLLHHPPTPTPTRSLPHSRTATATATTATTTTATATATVTTQTPTPTPTPATATATPTRMATATTTALATATPTVAVTATPSTPMIEGVAVCPTHDPIRWHALVERNADSSIRCTYGHEHHDDPNLVNDLFGAPSAWYGGTQSISYPWQTFAFTNPQPDYYPLPAAGDPSTFENATKHNGYKWYVKRDLPCVPFAPAPNDGCLRAWRIQVHSLGTVADTTVRFHSFSLEVVVDYRGTQGIVRGGGWMDAGFLGLLVDTGTEIVCPPLATNPPGFNCPGVVRGTMREAYSTNVPAPHTPHSLPGSTSNWYAAHRGGAQPGPSVEDFGPIDYTNPSRQQFHPPEARANNSRGNLENMAAVTDFDWLRPYIGADGRINARLWQNRHGQVTTSCTVAAVDCVPFIVEGALPGQYMMNRNTNVPAFTHPDHDVASPVTGNSLITYPN